MNNNKTILVTGSNGLLGQKLTDLYLGTPGIELIATGIGANRYPHENGYAYVQMDISNKEQVHAVFQQYKPQTIINTAAMTLVDDCETQQDLCMKLNVEAVGILAEESKAIGGHLIHLSTDFIFPGTKKMYTETDEAEPLSVYGMSKWLGEKQVMEKAGLWSIVRTIIVYGVAHQLSRSNTVLWAYNTLKNQSAAKVIDDQFRTPTLAEDLAKGCQLIEQQQATGIYNIAGKDYMSILETVQRIAKHFGFSMKNISVIKSEELNQPAKRPPITGLDISKAKRDLGYKPHDFEAALDIFESQLNKNIK